MANKTQAPTCKIDLPGGIGIRAYRDSDTASISRSANNPNVVKHLRDRFPFPYTEEVAKSWFDIVTQEENMTRSGKWTVEHGAEGPLTVTNYAVTVNDEAVGAIGLDFGKDIYLRTAEIGYWLGEEHWGKGVMSKAVPPFIQWAWDTFGVLARVNGEVNAENKGSASILKKAGFVVEGHRSNGAFKNGEFVDLVILGMVRPS
ncbi:hypothetical protein M409DRAFT_62552 [Zasmidium cellare ATCC 36951]|uniref:N-acetyltransferase domain-containing protein n=1 Tax=Zasmidium cellare ATCC 36951 TaxID=1080233 RepID=A0A6A6D1G5_ZASCE|nr:uncharacterized protein M409DRAFT_62552 [Zasmidium cellare ATCC 36951]KAF2172893.1 hypothetical protein M409DRAFT_62552 [Zasmidium cellare ATCC 36951]